MQCGSVSCYEDDGYPLGLCRNAWTPGNTRRLQSLTDDVVDPVSAVGQACWASSEPDYAPTDVRSHSGNMPWDVNALVVPVPSYGTNWNTDTTLDACRALCDRTVDCNHIAFVPAIPSTNRKPGCYMYAAEHPGENLEDSESVASALTIDVANVLESEVVFQTRKCPAADVGTLGGALTNYGLQPSVAFGEATDNADIKIAFLDKDDYADVVTVSGRDHVRWVASVPR